MKDWKIRPQKIILLPVFWKWQEHFLRKMSLEGQSWGMVLNVWHETETLISLVPCGSNDLTFGTFFPNARKNKPVKFSQLHSLTSGNNVADEQQLETWRCHWEQDKYPKFKTFNLNTGNPSTMKMVSTGWQHVALWTFDCTWTTFQRKRQKKTPLIWRCSYSAEVHKKFQAVNRHWLLISGDLVNFVWITWGYSNSLEKWKPDSAGTALVLHPPPVLGLQPSFC